MTDDTGDMIAGDAAIGSALPVLGPAGGALAMLHDDLERAVAYKKAARASATHRA